MVVPTATATVFSFQLHGQENLTAQLFRRPVEAARRKLTRRVPGNAGNGTKRSRKGSQVVITDAAP